MAEVDDADKSPLPHVYALKNGLNFLIDTGSEISVLKPSAYDKRNQTEGRFLSAVNKSCIATYGNKPLTLEFGPKQIFIGPLL